MFESIYVCDSLLEGLNNQLVSEVGFQARNFSRRKILLKEEENLPLYEGTNFTNSLGTLR